MSKSLSEIIKEYRISKGLSTRDLKELTGVSQSYFSRIELQGLIPSPKILKKMATHLDLDYNQLLRSAGYSVDTSEFEIVYDVDDSIETVSKNQKPSHIIDLEDILLNNSYKIRLNQQELTAIEKEKLLAIVEILIK